MKRKNFFKVAAAAVCTSALVYTVHALSIQPRDISGNCTNDSEHICQFICANCGLKYVAVNEETGEAERGDGFIFEGGCPVCDYRSE